MAKYKTLKVLGKQFKAELLTKNPESLELNKISAIQLLHEQTMAKRRRHLSKQSKNMFKVTCLEDLPIDEDVPPDELAAEKIVSHERLVLTDSNFNVIHGHETVLKALEEKNTVIVLKIMGAVSAKDSFLLQVRHAAKEGILFPAIRFEAIRILHDDYGLEIRQIQLLLVGPKGDKKSPKEVTSELRTGRIFENYPGYTVPFKGFELDKHSFSNLKYLVGNNAIFEQMSQSKQDEKHFLDLAIDATKTRSKRLNSEIPPLMQHEDTRELLFTQGLRPARDLLKAKYPEDNYDHHPQNDLISAIEKLRRPENLVLLKKHLDLNPLNNSFFKQAMELMNTISEISTPAQKAIMKMQMESDPELFASVLAESHPELAVQGVVNAQNRFSKILEKVQ